MIIVHPHNIVGAKNLIQSVTETMVDFFVLLPKFRVVNRERGEIVKQRPERRVAEPEIEPFHLLFGKKHRMGRELLADALDQRIFQRLIDAGPRPAHPQVIAGEMRRLPSPMQVRR